MPTIGPLVANHRLGADKSSGARVGVCRRRTKKNDLCRVERSKISQRPPLAHFSVCSPPHFFVRARPRRVMAKTIAKKVQCERRSNDRRGSSHVCDHREPRPHQKTLCAASNQRCQDARSPTSGSRQNKHSDGADEAAEDKWRPLSANDILFVAFRGFRAPKRDEMVAAERRAASARDHDDARWRDDAWQSTALAIV